MSFTAWRITKRKHAKTAFSGSGSRKYGGRWNSPGTAVVYTAQTQSLAVLEMLVHLDGPELLQCYVLIGVEIEESSVREVGVSDLPRNWGADPAPVGLRRIGDEWVEAGTSAVLRVPSTLVPAESNFLLNPAHGDFGKLVVGDPIAFDFDQRLGKTTAGSHLRPVGGDRSKKKCAAGLAECLFVEPETLPKDLPGETSQTAVKSFRSPKQVRAFLKNVRRRCI